VKHLISDANTSCHYTIPLSLIILTVGFICAFYKTVYCKNSSCDCWCITKHKRDSFSK